MATFRMLLILLGTVAGAAAMSAAGGQEWSAAATPPPAPKGVTFTAHLSAGLIKATLEQPKEQTESVRDLILDTHIFGIARTRASVDAELVPDPCSVTVDVVVRGTTQTSSVGIQEPVKIYTISNMPFVLRKRISINTKGIFGAPPLVQLKASTYLRGITDLQGQEFPLVEVAEKRFNESRAEATYWVECKARKQLFDRFEREIVPKLQKAQQAYAAAMEVIQPKLEQLDVKLHFYSTPAYASLAVETSSASPARTIVPPPPVPVGWDVAIRLHDSVVNDFARSILAGKTFSFEELNNLEELLPNLLRGKDKTDGKLKKGDTGRDVKEPADVTEGPALTFDRKDPVVLDFVGQGFKVAIQGENYRTGGEDYQGFRVQATYKIEDKSGKIAVVRQGALEVQPVGKPSGKQKILPKVELAFLRQAFDNLFLERVDLPEFDLPAPLDKIGVRLAHRVEVQNDWLLLAWQRKQ
jgi:hypothetical protein